MVAHSRGEREREVETEIETETAIEIETEPCTPRPNWPSGLASGGGFLFRMPHPPSRGAGRIACGPTTRRGALLHAGPSFYSSMRLALPGCPSLARRPGRGHGHTGCAPCGVPCCNRVSQLAQGSKWPTIKHVLRHRRLTLTRGDHVGPPAPPPRAWLGGCALAARNAGCGSPA